MTLKDRISEIVASGFTKAAIARAAGKTASAVTQWLTGDSQSIKADSAAGISLVTGFSAVWIATGKGPKMTQAQEKTATGLTPSANALGVLFDMIPANDLARRSQAWTAASEAIRHVIEGQ